MTSAALPVAESTGSSAPARPRLSAVISQLTAANLAIIAATAITAPLQARALGPTGRGELAAIMVPLGLAPVIFTIGLPLYTHRAAAIGKRAGTLIGTIGATYLVLGLVAAGLGPAVGTLVGGGPGVVRNWIIIGFALLPIGFINMVITDVAAGQNRWRSVLMLRITPPAVMLVSIPCLFLTGHLTVASVALVSIAGGTLPVIYLVASARQHRPLRFRPSILRGAVPFGLRAWAAGLGQLVNVRADQLLMTRLVAPRELGLYAVAVTASGVFVNSFASALAAGTMPRFATGDTDLIERTLRTTLLGVLITSACVALLSPIIVPLFFGSAFSDAVPMIWILLAAGVPLTGAVLLSSALTISGWPTYAALAELVALGITVPGLLVLLPIMGGIGAALVSLIAYTASFSILVFVACRRLGARITRLLLIRPTDAFMLAAIVRSQIHGQLGKIRSSS